MPDERACERQAELLFLWSLLSSDPEVIRRLRERAFKALVLARSTDDDVNRVLQQAWEDFEQMREQ
jgi:hypothetical protein